LIIHAVEYLDFVTKLQKSDNPKYRDQRRNPKVIVPESFHKDGYANDFTIELKDPTGSFGRSVLSPRFAVRLACWLTLEED
jgi:hypothetical protein